MNDLPRRSARLSQLHQQQSSVVSLSPSSTPSSTFTPSYPSPPNNFVLQQDRLRLQLQSQLLQTPQQFHAPLPSPSTNEINPFFQFTQTDTFQMPQQSQQAAQQSQQSYSRANTSKSQQQQVGEPHKSFSSQPQQQPNMQTGNNPGQLPPDFLAEAARRAQIACLMRDLGDVTL